MVTAHIVGPEIRIETDGITACVKTSGYVSGVAAGTFIDKATGAADLGFGLDIADFLLAPETEPETTPAEFRYQRDATVHGNLPRRYVELPQICTQARHLPAEVWQGDDWVAVRQWFTYTSAAPGFRSGSRWEQTLLFRAGDRYFLSANRIVSANPVRELLFRHDMPGHLKHHTGDTFSEIYLSYYGHLPAAAFAADFPPDHGFLYERPTDQVPARMIRAYRIRSAEHDEVWLAGMTLDPAAVYSAWCHQRGYVCFIQEIGGFPVDASGELAAAHVVGYFDSVDAMEKVYDQHAGVRRLSLPANGRLVGTVAAAI